MNKRAASFDNVYVLVSFFVLCLIALIGQKVWSELSTSEMDEQVWDKTSVGQSTKVHAQRFYDNLDTIIFMVYVALHIGILILAFLLRTHPVFYVVAIFIIIIIGIIGAVFSNVYVEITEDSDFASISSTMPKVGLLMQHFPKFEIIFGFLTSIVLYGLARGSEII